MKELLYKKPALACLVLNSLTLFFYLFLLQKGHYISYTPTLFIGLFNKQLIDNGVDLSLDEKMLVYFSFAITLIIIFVATCY